MPTRIPVRAAGAFPQDDGALEGVVEDDAKDRPKGLVYDNEEEDAEQRKRQVLRGGRGGLGWPRDIHKQRAMAASSKLT
jgi:hypothetical protein